MDVTDAPTINLYSEDDLNSTQDDETSVSTNNSPSQDCTNPDD